MPLELPRFGSLPTETGRRARLIDAHEQDTAAPWGGGVLGALAAVHRLNQLAVGGEGGGVQTFTTQVRLANDDGAWVGGDHGVFAFAEGVFAGTVTNVLTGEDGYEGLSLMLTQSWDADSERHWGVIVPSELVPPMPEPVEEAPE